MQNDDIFSLHDSQSHCVLKRLIFKCTLLFFKASLPLNTALILPLFCFVSARRKKAESRGRELRELCVSPLLESWHVPNESGEGRQRSVCLSDCVQSRESKSGLISSVGRSGEQGQSDVRCVAVGLRMKRAWPR